MAGINASVGKFGGGKQCYNFARDQRVVQDLLNRISAGQGGADGALTAPIIDRIVSAPLHAAILKFQTINRCSVDGHVDPNAQTIRLMNQLAGASPLPTPPSPSFIGLESVIFWLNAFIPINVCTKKGDLFVITLPDNVPGAPVPILRFFTGDQREFSTDQSASARMHSEVTIVGLSSDDPRISTQRQVCGESQEVDSDGNIIATATADTNRMRFLNFRGSQTIDPNGGVIDGIPGSVQIDLSGAASLPLFAKAADIDYAGTLIIDRLEGNVLFKGAVDEFPAFEMYFRPNGGNAVTLAQIPPITPLGLIGEPSRRVDVASRIVL
jgi:Protein of unknown function (DUF3238)